MTALGTAASAFLAAFALIVVIVWATVPVFFQTTRVPRGTVRRAGRNWRPSVPFSPRELAARVRTVLRRAAPAVGSIERLSFDGLELDAETREVRRHGTELKLTAKEFDLLWFLASNPRKVFSRDQLMSRVWGYEAALDTGTITVHVRRLREKIEDRPSHPRFLQTVWGVGYRFAP